MALYAEIDAGAYREVLAQILRRALHWKREGKERLAREEVESYYHYLKKWRDKIR